MLKMIRRLLRNADARPYVKHVEAHKSVRTAPDPMVEVDAVLALEPVRLEQLSPITHSGGND